MKYHPREVLISPTTRCNLRCPHCGIKQSDRILRERSAKKFLKECKGLGIERVGFTGGEPFMAVDFLITIIKEALKFDMLFGNITTNAAWHRNEKDLKTTLHKLLNAGFDGQFIISVDAFHDQDLKKVAHFIRAASSTWNRDDVVSIVYTSGAPESETSNKLKNLSRLLSGRLMNFEKAHPYIKAPAIFIKILKIDLSPVGKASALKNGWDGKWFREDRCKGPGNIFFVLPNGDVKPCCGYATDSRALTIGNINRESAKVILKNAGRNRFVSTIFNSGLNNIRKRLERLGVKFPGRASNHCFFCHYILTRIPKNILNRCLDAAKVAFLATSLLTAVASPALAETLFLKTAKPCPAMKSKVIKRIPLPRGYHEGLFYNGEEVWVNNGKNGRTWVVDIASALVKSKLDPAATFAEAVTRDSDNVFFATDWDEKKIYRLRIEDNKMIPESSISVAPAHPAGLAWNGSGFFAITWTRGLGTRFDLLEMGPGLNVIRKIKVKNIQEPAHLAWDGKDLWITSWYNSRVYKVDIEKMQVIGYFTSPAWQATGIAWDGKYFWITGTHADLYQVEVNTKEEEVMKINLSSANFKDGAAIPKKYTCDGDGISPALNWSGAPAGTKSFALINDDPDAPSGDFVHWVIFNIPSDSKGLPENIAGDEILADGTTQGTNDARKIGYCSPCPPRGIHRYYFKIYVLDKMLDLKPGCTKKDLLKAMEGHILAEGQLMGRYKR